MLFWKRLSKALNNNLPFLVEGRFFCCKLIPAAYLYVILTPSAYYHAERISVVIGLTVCFIGHRRVGVTEGLRSALRALLLELIHEGATEFLFGDHSQFNDLCYDAVTALRQDFPQIRRVKLRTDNPELSENTKRFFFDGYEDNICPAGVAASARAAYVERNQAMIRESDVCVFYYDSAYSPPRRRASRRSVTDYQPNSGTALAYAYAVKLGKRVVNLFEGT